MEGRDKNRKKPTKGRKRRTTYEDLKRESTEQGCEFVPVSEHVMGFVIGKQGNTIKQIQEQSGAKVTGSRSEDKPSGFMVRGNEEQIACAKELIIKKANFPQAGRSKRGGFKMLQNLIIPERLMGHVIGQGRKNLNTIQTKTGVALKVIDKKLHVNEEATEREEKLAVREIRELVSLGLKRSRLSVPFTRFVHVDTAQLEENHEFQLTIVHPSANDVSLGETCYTLQLLEHPLKEETYPGFEDTDRLKAKILKVLKQIHREKGDDEVRVDMWCHFGHAYITKVDEDELDEIFTLKDIKQKVGNAGNKSWKTLFKEGMKEMEVEAITSLPSQATEEDIRHDFTFYTPSCRTVRVKAWLIEETSEEGSEAESSMAFSRTAPKHVPVKNILTRVQSDEQGETSNAPCFHICSDFHKRMKVDILMPSKGLDCRLSIRTCKNYVPKTPEVDEEDKILESYLMGMELDKHHLTLPPASELQDGFDLFYQRRSLRKTYQYEMEGEKFSLTVCKDQARNVDPCDPNTGNMDEIPVKTDIHLHCDEWDRALDEGDWEPEQIVAKLPTFLQFLRKVQRNVSPINDN